MSSNENTKQMAWLAIHHYDVYLHPFLCALGPLKLNATPLCAYVLNGRPRGRSSCLRLGHASVGMDFSPYEQLLCENNVCDLLKICGLMTIL